MTDPVEVDELLSGPDRRTLARDDLRRRHERMDDVSPRVGVLDPVALAGAVEEDLDAGVALLIDLARATDPALRRSARRLAASILLPPARVAGPASAGGSARLATVRDGGVDLDLEATFDRLGERPDLAVDDLRWRAWRRPGRAVMLVVDASGSVTGPPLSTAVVVAAALAARTGPTDELAVVAFWSKVVVLRHVRDPAPPSAVLDRLLALRGGDTTDLAGGLRAALAQAGLSLAARRDVIVLTDGMANEGSDPLAIASTASGVGAAVHVLALSSAPDALDACAALAGAGGGRMAVLDRPSQAPAALIDLLGR